jgi:SAM-dependent methyltransferase
MSFAVAAAAYDEFMGRFSGPLAVPFADLLDLGTGDRVLDVGCGPGALSAELVRRVGVERVSAIDPMAAFTEAVSVRLPGVDVRSGPAEHLPWDDDTFDAVAAQLVVHFMADPAAGLREMARVTRPGGRVAACVWDYEQGGAPLAAFWRAVHALDPSAAGEVDLAGAREGQLAELLGGAGLRDVRAGTVSVIVGFAAFEDWWRPFTHGVGPAGQYVVGLDDARRAELARLCADELGEAPFEVVATAWSAVGIVG